MHLATASDRYPRSCMKEGRAQDTQGYMVRREEVRPGACNDSPREKAEHTSDARGNRSPTLTQPGGQLSKRVRAGAPAPKRPTNGLGCIAVSGGQTPSNHHYILRRCIQVRFDTP